MAKLRQTKLPSSILQLRLETFSAHPNPWLQPTPSAESPRTAPVLPLSDMCLNLLISPRSPHNLPPLLENYRFDPAPGQRHPLLDAQALHDAVPYIPMALAQRILQSLKSCANNKSVVYPRSNTAPLPDDAAANPFFEPCPSPRHHEIRQTPYGQVRRALFLRAAEERLEWRDVFGIPDLPIQWRGCSPGCLDFLDDDEWDLSSEYGEAW